MNCIPQASLSMEFSSQEYWSGWLFPSLGNLPNPGAEAGSPSLQVDSISSEPLGKPMYRCESWIHKETWVLKNWCFQAVVLENTLESPLDTEQSILKEINPEYSLEGLMLKLKLQYFGHLLQHAYSLEETLMLGKTEGRRRRGQQRIRWLDGITNSTDVSLSKL